jgi:hypothetical protein
VITPGTAFAFYLLAGLLFFFWSQQFTPRSRAAFDDCFRYSRVVWVIGIVIAGLLWPIFAIGFMYRFMYPRADKDEKPDR